MKKILGLHKRFVIAELSLVTTGLFLILVLGTPFFASAQGAPIKDVQGIIDLTKKIAGWMQAIFWTAAVIAIFYAAFLFLTGSGEAEKVQKAKKQLLYALIALVIGIMAWGFQPLIENILGGGGGVGDNIGPLPLTRPGGFPPLLLQPPLTPGQTPIQQPTVPPSDIPEGFDY